LCLELKNANIIFRPHPVSIHHFSAKLLYKKVLKDFSNVYFEDTTHSSLLGPDKNLVAADILVTDLSSIVADFMSLEKPAVFLYPDFTKGIWGPDVPSYSQAARVSYTVKDFSELYKLLNKLLRSKENIQMIKKRRRFVSEALFYRDGLSGRRFRRILDEQVRQTGTRDFFETSYLKRLIRYFLFILKGRNLFPVEMELLDL